MHDLAGRIVFNEFAIDNNFTIDPRIFIFSQKAITSHQKSLSKTMFQHAKLHILRRAGTEMTSGPVDRGQNLLVK